MESLLTRDRLMKWGAIDSAGCPLCYHINECHDHLFFACSYSFGVWSKLLRLQSIHRTAKNWQEEKQWAATYATGRSVKAEIYWMCLAGAIYHVWLERNSRVFREGQMEERAMVRQIIQ
ncbi:uncharacterized protein LOC132611836 [Lycium barbarum]|uniref:uncharacterized protein LOC132611836 n=1 Tax=Lycium barbarum TaxID=112863 RepID=UPI00293F63D4|nr:uncharacterized protein LOC132611836 [Lycium barbarum]